MTPAAGGPVLARVEALAAALQPLLDPVDLPRAAQVRAGLHEPLRLAVVGRVSTGKSTLVNALVGRRIAATDAGECTRHVTWYRYGAPDRATLHLRDGSVRELTLQSAAQPQRWGVPPAEVERIEVRLASGPLRDLVLIDTPGLETLTAANAAATRRAVVGSQDAAGQSDALLYLIGDTTRGSDVAFLSDFRAASGRAGASAVNSIGVLAMADRFGGGPLEQTDPFEVAAAAAARLAQEHRSLLSAVVPVSGLLAQSARTGALNEETAVRAAALRGLDPVLLSLEAAAHEDLLTLLGPYGLAAGRAPAAVGATALRRWCESVSGIAAVESLIRTRLVPRTALLKAGAAVHELGLLAERAGARRSEALGLVESALLHPDLHPLQELRALGELAVELPGSPMVAELEALLLGTPAGLPAGVASGAALADRIERARQRSGLATAEAALALHPAQVRAARVLARSYQLLARRLAGQAAPPAPT
jgi:hypothetical protein